MKYLLIVALLFIGCSYSCSCGSERYSFEDVVKSHTHPITIVQKTSFTITISDTDGEVFEYRLKKASEFDNYDVGDIIDFGYVHPDDQVEEDKSNRFYDPLE